LVATGVGVNGVVADETTALHRAAANGHVEAVQTLMQLRADNEAKAAKGAKPPH
jgi:ankyrin repeat protein